MIDIKTLTDEEFDQLPLVIRGASKEVRYAGNGLVVIRYLPSIYSMTHNRCADVEGSQTIRLRAMKTFLEVVRAAGLQHAYQQINERFVLSKLVMPHQVEFDKYGIPPFVPEDLDEAAMRALPHAPPIEIIVKRMHMGTSKHRLIGMSGTRVRHDHPLFGGFMIEADGAYPSSIVRFDWRNPLEHKGKRVADEALPSDIADYFIDVRKAERSARQVFSTLQDYLAVRDIVICDLCLFIDQAGTLVYGEITPDCGRFRHFVLGELDKDVWCAGGSSELVLQKWSLLAEMIARPVVMRALVSAELYHVRQEVPMNITIGTTNPGKVAEIAAIFAPTGIQLHPFSETDPEETGTAFLENARIKAKAYALATGRITIAEDSGLCVGALKGLPGVHSARFSDCRVNYAMGEVLEHVPSARPRAEIDHANNLLVLESMREALMPHRAAYFEVAMVVAAPDGTVLFEAKGTSYGWISSELRGTHGFGYDPIFIGNDTGEATYAELDSSRKNLRSHRRRVLEELAFWLARSLKRRDEQTVVVDGNDGTGKSTLVTALRAYGYTVLDRGIPTKMTDDDVLNGNDREVYLILDAPIEVSRERLARAGRDLTEKYHTLEDLAYYRERFRSVADKLPTATVIDASGDAPSVLGAALKVLMR